jgi:hypothetical protein
MSEAIIQTHLTLSGSLEDAFTLQDEIRQLTENIKIIQRTIEERQARLEYIITDSLNSGVRQEGRLFLKEKPGRRTLDIKAFESAFPEAFQKVAKVKMSATITDAERVLPNEVVDSLCTRAPSTWEIVLLLDNGGIL